MDDEGSRGGAPAPVSTNVGSKRRRRRSWVLGLTGVLLVGVVAGGLLRARRATVAPGQRAPDLWAGAWHTCAVANDGIACWGKNSDGQLGDGRTLDTPTRRELVGFAAQGRVISLSAGKFHTCAVTDRQQLWCWGSNKRGQLTGAVAQGARQPQLVPVGFRPVAVAAGEAHSCVLGDDGRVRCFGDNGFGQLGTGTLGEPQPRPVEVSGLDDVVELDAGLDSTCARRRSGEVFCWGRNDDGQLGNDTLSPRARPARVRDLPPAAQLAVGGHSSCALDRDASVWCWGNGEHGRLGDGQGPQRRPRPAPVIDLPAVTQIATSPHFSCALTITRQIRCWGWGHWGNLGIGPLGDNESRASPSAVLQIDDAVGVAVGNQHACVRHDGGAISCWGDNPNGQLGDGTRVRRFEPVSTTGFP